MPALQWYLSNWVEKYDYINNLTKTFLAFLHGTLYWNVMDIPNFEVQLLTTQQSQNSMFNIFRKHTFPKFRTKEYKSISVKFKKCSNFDMVTMVTKVL